MPEPGGPRAREVETILKEVAAAKPVAGAGLSGLAPAPGNAEPLIRLVSSLGF